MFNRSADLIQVIDFTPISEYFIGHNKRTTFPGRVTRNDLAIAARGPKNSTVLFEIEIKIIREPSEKTEFVAHCRYADYRIPRSGVVPGITNRGIKQ